MGVFSALSSQLSALSSQLSALGASCLIVLLTAGGAPSQAPIPFSTHDHTTTAGSSTALFEGWADVKVPGKAPPDVATEDGRIYSVGTVNVQTTDQNDDPTFSGVEIRPADHRTGVTSTWQTFSFLGSGASRQVVVLQCAEPDGTIVWQNFYYGDSGIFGTQHATARGINARAISVWPGTSAAETRIAICGESHDATLPRSAQPPSWLWFNIGVNGEYASGTPSGFIAVYDGDGQLLWSYEFRYDNLVGQCAVTDVSIKVEQDGPRDVVTYCGISSFGVPAGTSGESSSPLLPFDAQRFAGPNHSPADGDTDNGPDQWDGFVGRISNAHVNPLPAATTREFHSVVGGRHQDGLWGLAELDGNRFAVVGGSATPTGATAGAPSFPFTLTQPQNWDTETDYNVGVVMVFDASATRDPVPGRLVLDKSTSLGSIGTQNSHARDVLVQFDADPAAGPAGHEIVVVGTTDDPNLFSSLLALGFDPTGLVPAGQTDGFVVIARDDTQNAFLFRDGIFQGDAAASGFTGVAAWNEYVDHFGVVGYTGGDLWLGSYYSLDLYTGPPPRPPLLELLRSRQVVNPAAIETPATMAPQNATVVGSYTGGSGLDYEDGGLGSPAGGAIAVDERGRLHVVGSTDGLGYPRVPPTSPLTRPFLGGTADAIRSTFDLLPARVGRSDQSGELVHNGIKIPVVPLGLTGATTPSAALVSFGRRIDGPTPQGSLRRMLIDWHGPAPAQTTAPPVADHFLLVDRPPVLMQVGASVIQYGVPTAPAGLSPEQLEIWVPSGVTHSVVSNPGAASLRIPLLLPPTIPGGVTFSVQVVTADLVPYSCSGCTTLAASPTIVFSY